jgi:hypothetical protein
MLRRVRARELLRGRGRGVGMLREGLPVTTLYWRPCPFYCPPAPNWYRSWADIMNARAAIPGPVQIDIPEGTPFPRGVHDLSGCHLVITEANVIEAIGEPGARCNQVPHLDVRCALGTKHCTIRHGART